MLSSCVIFCVCLCERVWVYYRVGVWMFALSVSSRNDWKIDAGEWRSGLTELLDLISFVPHLWICIVSSILDNIFITFFQRTFWCLQFLHFVCFLFWRWQIISFIVTMIDWWAAIISNISLSNKIFFWKETNKKHFLHFYYLFSSSRKKIERKMCNLFCLSKITAVFVVIVIGCFTCYRKWQIKRSTFNDCERRFESC